MESRIPGLEDLKLGDRLAGRYRLDAIARVTSSSIALTATAEPAVELEGHAMRQISVEIVLAAKAPPTKRVSDTIDDARVKFLAGARKASSLAIPNAVRVLDAGLTSCGQPFVVREPLPRLSLADVLADEEDITGIPTSRAVDLAIALCNALRVAHANGLVHGELGPRQVYLPDGIECPSTAKLVGIGTARSRARLAIAGDDPDDLEGASLRAPELMHLGAREGGERVDVWGIGILLHTMLAREAPFVAPTPSAASLAIALDSPPALAGVPDGLAEIIEHCLSKYPAARPPDIDVLARALEAFGSERSGAPAVHVPPAAESLPTLVISDAGCDALMRDDPDATAPRHALVAALVEHEILQGEPPSEVTIDVEFESYPALGMIADPRRALARAQGDALPRPVPPPRVRVARVEAAPRRTLELDLEAQSDAAPKAVHNAPTVRREDIGLQTEIALSGALADAALALALPSPSAVSPALAAPVPAVSLAPASASTRIPPAKVAPPAEALGASSPPKPRLPSAPPPPVEVPLRPSTTYPTPLPAGGPSLAVATETAMYRVAKARRRTTSAMIGLSVVGVLVAVGFGIQATRFGGAANAQSPAAPPEPSLTAPVAPAPIVSAASSTSSVAASSSASASASSSAKGVLPARVGAPNGKRPGFPFAPPDAKRLPAKRPADVRAVDARATTEARAAEPKPAESPKPTEKPADEP